MCLCPLDFTQWIVGVVLFFQERQTASQVVFPVMLCKMHVHMLSSEAEHSGAERYSLWVAIWWVSLHGSLRDPFSLRWNSFVQKWTSSLRPLCSSDPAPSPTSEIAQYITWGPSRPPGSRDGNLDIPGSPKQSRTRGLCPPHLVKKPTPACLALLHASRCGLIYCDSANCCN